MNKCLINSISVSLIYCQLQFCYGKARTRNVSVSAFVWIYWFFSLSKMCVCVVTNWWQTESTHMHTLKDIQSIQKSEHTFSRCLRKHQAINKILFMENICCRFAVKSNFIFILCMVCACVCAFLWLLCGWHHQKKKALVLIEINLQVYPI